MKGKEEFLRKFNEAYASGNVNYMVDQVTADVTWNVVGEDPIHGKEAFARAVKAMQNGNPADMTIHNIVTHGTAATVDGLIKIKISESVTKTYGFCDIYKFSGFKNPKIKELTSYVIEIR